MEILSQTLPDSSAPSDTTETKPTARLTISANALRSYFLPGRAVDKLGSVPFSMRLKPKKPLLRALPSHHTTRSRKTRPSSGRAAVSKTAPRCKSLTLNVAIDLTIPTKISASRLGNNRGVRLSRDLPIPIALRV